MPFGVAAFVFTVKERNSADWGRQNLRFSQ
jgi:hypothetical protein